MGVRRVAVLSLFSLAAACGGEATPAKAAPQGPAGPGVWRLDKDASSLGFRARQTGSAFEGRFESFEAAIVFDPADLENASVEVTVDMSSAKTGDRQRDAALPGGDWFKAREFPTARFFSDDIVADGAEGYVARGALTIRDATQPVVLPFTVEIDGDRAAAAGGLTLIRTDYGVGRGEFETDQWVGLEVEVFFDVEAVQ